jgi:hypothetical protein
MKKLLIVLSGIVMAVFFFGVITWPIISIFFNSSSEPNSEPTQSLVSYGQEGRLVRAFFDDSVHKMPVMQETEEWQEFAKAVEEKDLLTMSQMMDGGKLKLYPIGSKLTVISIRSPFCRVKFADGYKGWISEKMVGP